MSRPVIPALAVLFSGWSTVAVAAETPPDAESINDRMDMQSKQKKKSRSGPKASTSRSPVKARPQARAGSPPRHASGHGAVTRGPQGATSRSSTSASNRSAHGTVTRAPGNRSAHGTRQDIPTRRTSGAAQGSESAGPRKGVGVASGSRRPDMRGVELPGRRGGSGGPTRAGQEQPGARELRGEGPRIQERPGRVARPDRGIHSRGSDRRDERASSGLRVEEKPNRVSQSARGASSGDAQRRTDRAGSGGSRNASKGDAASRGGGGAAGGSARGGGPRIEPGVRGNGNGQRGQAERGTAGGTRQGNDARRGQGNAGRGQGKKPGEVRVERNRYVPDRWAPGYHRRGLGHMPRYHPQYWSSGVFLYNPPTHQHTVTVVETGGGTQTVEKNAEKPLRAVDRSSSFSVGLRGGSYQGRGLDGQRHADNGLGVAARYRFVESLGVEVAWARHLDSWETDSTRTTEPLAVSGQLFAFPWSRVSPYLSAGYTWTDRSSSLQGASDRVKGPHGGLGLELAIGDSAAIGVEGRYSHYGQLESIENISNSYKRAGALQGTLGMNFYF